MLANAALMVLLMTREVRAASSSHLSWERVLWWSVRKRVSQQQHVHNNKNEQQESNKNKNENEHNINRSEKYR